MVQQLGKIAFQVIRKGRDGLMDKEMAARNLPLWFSTSCKLPNRGRIHHLAKKIFRCWAPGWHWYIFFSLAAKLFCSMLQLLGWGW